jgi:hypothetical protein
MTNVVNAVHLSANMLAVAKIRGSRVYTTTLDQIASVEDLLVDIATGRVVQVVLKFGGHIGLGHHFYSLAWEEFSYDTELGGYIAHVDDQTLEKVFSHVAVVKDGKAPWNPSLENSKNPPSRGLCISKQ